MNRAAGTVLRIAVSLPFLVAGCGRETPPAEERGWGPGHAVFRLMADVTSIAPGQRFHLGFSFDIEPEWHLYANARNDTGFPITVRPRLPEGFEAGELLWPAPERHLSPGNILDHVYLERVTLLLPVRAPDPLPEGRRSFTAEAEWLVCREVCLPGNGKAALELPVGAGAESRASLEAPSVRERFTEARARLPRPLPPDGVRLSWEPEALRIRVEEAASLAFFPGPDCATLVNPIKDAVSESNELTLRFAPGGPDRLVAGVLSVTPRQSEPGFYTFSVSWGESPPEAAPSTQEEQ